jgi:dTDP-glucose 4,6-dehydratase
VSAKEPALPAADIEHVLNVAADAFESLRGARLFVTGGTGVFGTWLLESFVAAERAFSLGARAVVLTRSPDSFLRRRPHLAGLASLAFHAGDVRTFAFPEGSFSHVMHAATNSSTHPELVAHEEMLDTISEGTRRALEFARLAGARRFLFVSSGAVYGRQAPFGRTHLEEDDPFAPSPFDPASSYGEGKRFAELLCTLAHTRHGLETTVARSFAIVGPLVPIDQHFAAGNFLRDGLAGGPIRVGGDGTPYRSYLHTADLMVWLWTMLVRGRPARAYNMGSDQAISIADLARKFADIFDTEVTIARVPNPGQPPAYYVPSIRRAEDELGLKVVIGLDEALARTVAWHRSLAAAAGVASS